MITISIPAVQTKIAKKVTQSLKETYDVDINIDRVGLNWKGQLGARDVFIQDHKLDTLIYARELQTDLLNLKSLLHNTFSLGDIKMKDALLNFKTYQGDERDNLSIFSLKFSTGKPPSDMVFTLTADEVILKNSRVRIIDERIENPNILIFNSIDLEAENFKVLGTEVFAAIKNLSLTTEKGIDIEKANTIFSYTKNEMKLENLVLKTSQSFIDGTVVFTYGEKGMSNFIENVSINASFNKTKLATNDLNVFYNEFGENQILAIEGNIEGTINSFHFTNAIVKNQGTLLQGDFIFSHIITPTNSFVISGNKHTIRTNYYDLRRFMPRIIGANLPQELKRLGNISILGTTTISPDQLTTVSILSGSLGKVDLAIVIDNYTNSDTAFYEGSIELFDFDLGTFTGTSSLGKIAADLAVKGKGFTQQSVDANVKGTIGILDFNGYTYKNLVLSGLMKDPIFNGEVSIDDPNIKLDFKGLVDVSKDFNQYDFNADVAYADLNKLNLITRDSIAIFAGKINMDMDGNTVDNVQGSIEFKETFYQNERDDFYFDDFKITASFDDEVRTIEINSPDIVNGSISGVFKMEDIPNLFQNGIASSYANYVPQEVTTNQYINYEFTVFSKIVEVFVPQIQLGENTKIKGEVYSDQSKFKLDFNSPEMLLLSNYLGKVTVNVDNDHPLYNTYISVDSINTGSYQFTEIDIINKTLNDTLYVQSEFKGGKNMQDAFDLSLYHTINTESKSVIGFLKSNIIYNNNTWYINKNKNDQNKIVFDDNFRTIRIDTMSLQYKDEFITFGGIVKDSTYKDLKVNFKNVTLGHLIPSIDSLQIAGKINGDVDFLQKGTNYYPNAAVEIKNIAINTTRYGDLNLIVRGNNDLSAYDVNTTLISNGKQLLSARGEIDVSQNPTIDLNVAINEFDIAPFSPLGKDVFSDLRGIVSGSAVVKGNYNSPDINGRLTLNNGGLLVDELNTNFAIDNNSSIKVTKNKFEIVPTSFKDVAYNTTGRLSGNATHSNFGDWELNLDIQAPERLLVLDKEQVEDALYYGTAFISGNAQIYGPIDELIIDVEATTEEGTTFKIPISETESIGDDSFVTFISPAEKEALINGETFVSKEIKGVELNFELDINQNAEVEVVVDQTNGSSLIGRGAGILLLEINTNGKFNMWGDFLVIEGKYNFKYGGLIEKEIDVVPGGSITWDGKPERANLNLSAVYTTQANPSVLLDNPTVNRDIPVEVVVDLSGELIKPGFVFDINFPRTSSIVRSELEYKLQNQEERQKQAIFLLAQSSFVNEDFGGGNTFGANLLADRVSSLVGDLLSDDDGKFKLALDYQTGNNTPVNQTADRVGVSLSTQITERILINGNVGVPIGGVNESAVAGDIEVQWLINEDGSLRMNFFNRQADIQFIGEEQIFEQGLGMSYSVDFNTFKQLVFKLFNKRLSLEKEKEQELEVIPDDNRFFEDFENPRE